MSENDVDMKASAVFAFGLHHNPIVELTKVTNMKAGGMYLPAIEAKAVVPGNSITSVKFALLACDLVNEDELEKFRQTLHQRIDRTIDNYKTNRPKKPAVVEPAPTEPPVEEPK